MKHLCAGCHFSVMRLWRPLHRLEPLCGRSAKRPDCPEDVPLQNPDAHEDASDRDVKCGKAL